MTRNPTKVEYAPAAGSRLTKKDAVVIGSRLTEIEDRFGSVTAERVLQDARPSTSPLHRYFEWDDRRAADAHRLERARYLIRSVKIIVESEPERSLRVRAFVKVEGIDEDEEEDVGFVGVLNAMGNDEHRRQVVGRALKEARDWRDRYKSIDELAEIVEAIDHVLGRKK